jgi:hypothetical protein
MRNLKIYLTTLAIAGVLFATQSCVDNTESESVSNLRNAKATELTANADYLKAQARYLDIKAAFDKLIAEAEAELIQAKVLTEAKNAQYIEAQANYEQAKADYEDAKSIYEANLAEAQAQIALAEATLIQNKAIAYADSAREALTLQKEENAKKIAEYRAEIAEIEFNSKLELIRLQTVFFGQLANLQSGVQNQIFSYYSLYSGAVSQANSLRSQLATKEVELLQAELELVSYQIDSAKFVKNYIVQLEQDTAFLKLDLAYAKEDLAYAESYVTRSLEEFEAEKVALIADTTTAATNLATARTAKEAADAALDAADVALEAKQTARNVAYEADITAQSNYYKFVEITGGPVFGWEYYTGPGWISNNYIQFDDYYGVTQTVYATDVIPNLDINGDYVSNTLVVPYKYRVTVAYDPFYGQYYWLYQIWQPQSGGSFESNYASAEEYKYWISKWEVDRKDLEKVYADNQKELDDSIKTLTDKGKALLTLDTTYQRQVYPNYLAKKKAAEDAEIEFWGIVNNPPAANRPNRADSAKYNDALLAYDYTILRLDANQPTARDGKGEAGDTSAEHQKDVAYQKWQDAKKAFDDTNTRVKDLISTVIGNKATLDALNDNLLRANENLAILEKGPRNVLDLKKAETAKALAEAEAALDAEEIVWGEVDNVATTANTEYEKAQCKYLRKKQRLSEVELRIALINSGNYDPENDADVLKQQSEQIKTITVEINRLEAEIAKKEAELADITKYAKDTDLNKVVALVIAGLREKVDGLTNTINELKAKIGYQEDLAKYYLDLINTLVAALEIE